VRGVSRIQRGTGAARERGSALLELALAMPVVLALIGAIVDGGWALHQAALVTAAAEAAQRTAALQDTGTGHCAGAPPASYGEVSRAAAAAAAPTLDPSRLIVTLRYLEPACSGRMRTLIVDVTYTLHALTPWFVRLLNGRHLTAEAGSAVEEVPPPWWGSAAQVLSDRAQLQAQQSQIAAQFSQIASQQAELVALQSQLGADQFEIVSQQNQLGAQQSQIASQQSQLAADQSAISSQQSQLAADQSAMSSQQTQLAADQSSMNSLMSSYQAMLSAYQSASSAYQAEVSLASALSQTAAYYYALWHQLLTQGASDGVHEQ
jgi:TadE-like protein